MATELNKDYATFGRQISYIIGNNIILLLLGLIRIPILTKGLGASLYGTWSLVSVTISLIVPFAVLGFTTSVVRLLAAEKDKDKIGEDFTSAFFVVSASGAIFSLLLFFFSDPLAESIFKDVNLSQYIKLGSALILFSCMSRIALSFFRTFRQIGRLTIITLAKNVFEIGLIILAVLLGYKLFGVITAIIINDILFISIILFIFLKQIGFHVPRFSRLKPHLRFGLPLTPSSATVWIIKSSDRYIISYFLGAAATGIYNAAYVMASYASFSVAPIGALLFPTTSKSYDEDKLGESKNYLKYSLRYFMMVAIPSVFGLSILAKPILQILTTPEFVSGYTIVPFVATGAVFYGLYVICLNPIALVYKTGLITALLGTGAALNVVLNIILIPRMGISGAAVATLIAYGILGILTLIVSRRYMKFDLSIPFMLKSVFSSLIMAFCIWLINPESLALTIMTIFLGALIYFTVLLLIRGLSKDEIKFFTNFLKDSLKGIRVIK